LNDLEAIAARLSADTRDLVVKAAGTPARPLRKFVALASSPEMTTVRENIASAIQYPADSVLIFGESGTGKELAARIIHAEDRSRTGKYVAISPAEADAQDFLVQFFGKSASSDDASAFRGLAYAADHGTLIFDQLEKYDSRVLNALLRFMDERMYVPAGSAEPRSVDIRFIGILTLAEDKSPTEVLPTELLARFSKRIHLPPLRRRRNEIDSIVSCWLQSGELSLRFPLRFIGDPEVIEAFKRYDWPDNLRGLERAVKAMCERAGSDLKLTMAHLPSLV
jgi:DNA-binding NtrC family response regulator